MLNIENFQNTLYCITAEKYSNGKNNIEVVASMLKGGASIIQYREKTKSMREKYYECLEIRKLTKNYNATFIVNDDIALAISVNACGIHIGQDDMPVDEVRKIIPKNMIIGLSTHNESQAQIALQSKVDYIGVGPIYHTETKVDVCSPVGIKYLDYVVNNVNIPFVAIGGIKENNIDEVLEHKAKTICMVTEIVGSNNIEDIVKRNIEKIKNY